MDSEKMPTPIADKLFTIPGPVIQGICNKSSDFTNTEYLAICALMVWQVKDTTLCQYVNPDGSKNGLYIKQFCDPWSLDYTTFSKNIRSLEASGYINIKRSKIDYAPGLDPAKRNPKLTIDVAPLWHVKCTRPEYQKDWITQKDIKLPNSLLLRGDGFLLKIKTLQAIGDYTKGEMYKVLRGCRGDYWGKYSNCFKYEDPTEFAARAKSKETGEPADEIWSKTQTNEYDHLIPGWQPDPKDYKTHKKLMKKRIKSLPPKEAIEKFDSLYGAPPPQVDEDTFCIFGCNRQRAVGDAACEKCRAVYPLEKPSSCVRK